MARDCPQLSCAGDCLVPDETLCFQYAAYVLCLAPGVRGDSHRSLISPNERCADNSGSSCNSSAVSADDACPDRGEFGRQFAS